MSLDVSLYEPFPVSRAACLWCAQDDPEHVHRGDLLFEQNITHNLDVMATEAGFYEALWRPEELFEEPRARDIVPLLRQGLDKMRASPEKYIALEPANKWGTYATFIPWIERYVAACLEYPDAVVHVSR